MTVYTPVFLREGWSRLASTQPPFPRAQIDRADGGSLEAVRIGHSEMRLDTLPIMREALSLYQKGRVHADKPYYETPIAGQLS